MRNKLLLLLLFLPFSAWAQQAYEHKAERYRVEYRDGHFLRKNDHTLHFVKLNVEWPVCLDYQTLDHLHRYLTSQLFGNDEPTLERALDHYLDSLGTPLTQVPDDGSFRTYYHTLDLTEVEYVAGRYISMRMVNKCEPKDTAERGSETQTLFTYDLIHDQVMTARELLRASARRTNSATWWELTKNIVYNMPGELEEGDDLFTLWSEGCLMRLGMVFDVGEDYDGSLYHLLSIVPEKEARKYMSKQARALLDEELPERAAPDYDATGDFHTADTAKVYVVAQEMPTFQGFLASSPEMNRYLVQNVRYPRLEQLLQIDGRVVVQFIVEKDGSVSSVAVINPISPGLDREAVRVISQMPRWQPGRIDGQPVRMLMHLPVTYKIF